MKRNFVKEFNELVESMGKDKLKILKPCVHKEKGKVMQFGFYHTENKNYVIYNVKGVRPKQFQEIVDFTKQ